MFQLIIKKARFELTKNVFVILGIASVIALVLVLEGFREGIYRQIRDMVINRDADIIVAQAGISNMIASRSVLPQLSRIAVEEIDGVVNAHPLTILPVIYTRDNRRMPVFVLVYDTRGGPKSIITGGGIGKEREIVIDKSLAVTYGLQPGDEFNVNDYKFIVAGISENTAAFFAAFAFVNYDELIDLYFESDIFGDLSTLPLLSFLLIEIEPGYDPMLIMKNIETRLPEVDAYLPKTIAENDVKMSRSMLGPVFHLMVVIAYVIGVLLIGFIMSSNVNDRKFELAVCKAMGFSFHRLALGVVMESLLLTLLAIPLACVFALVLSWLITEFAPVYLILPVAIEPLLRTFVASVVFALLGALFSFRVISRLEPVVALMR